MSEEKEKKKDSTIKVSLGSGKEDVEELREVLNVVSKEVPTMIRNILSSVFSEEAGRDMGKAAAAFYKQLKEAGMPEETAVKMTENYVSVFTSLSEIMKRSAGGRGGGDELGEEISRKVKEKLAEKHIGEKEEEEE